jgi:hypothetical protein
MESAAFIQYWSLCETGIRGFRRVSFILSKRDSSRVYPSKTSTLSEQYWALITFRLAPGY